MIRTSLTTKPCRTSLEARGHTPDPYRAHRVAYMWVSLALLLLGFLTAVAAPAAGAGRLGGARTRGRPLGVAVRGGGGAAELRAVDDAQRVGGLAGGTGAALRARAARGGRRVRTRHDRPVVGGPRGRPGLRRRLVRGDARPGDRPGARPAQTAPLRSPRPRSPAARGAARQRAARRPGGRAGGRVVDGGDHAPTGHHHGRTAAPEGPAAGRGPGTRAGPRPGPARLAAALLGRAHAAVSPGSPSSRPSARRCTGWWSWPPTTWPPAGSGG